MRLPLIEVFAVLIVFDKVMSFAPIIRRVSFKASYAYHMHIRCRHQDQSTSCRVISSTTSDVNDPLLIPIPSNQYNITDIPSVFAYPHYYDPHPIAKYASDRLKEQLHISCDFKSMLNNTDTVGKMMGVLVVQNNDTDNNNIPQLGYLQAYSGTLINDGIADMHFCPPVHDRDKDGFYKAGEDELNELNILIDQLESNPELLMQRGHLAELQEEQRNIKWCTIKKQRRDLLAIRDEQRSQLSKEEYNRSDKRLKQEKREMKKLKSQIKQEIQVAENAVNELEQHIQSLKDEHKTKSIQLQDTLFNQYNFLNIYNETKSLLPMFANTTIQRPPLGAGDCIAPKLLQYAFIKGYKPIAMAQFWWGNSPRNEVRRHGLYYPACRGKCGPILEHMLKGIEVEENPLQQINTESEVELEIIYEDEYIVVANKPEGILSQPGKYIDYSVYSIIKEMYPDATGPLLVHRLDMDTSGLLLIALDKDTHRALAAQFIDRSIQKRYVGEWIMLSIVVFLQQALLIRRICASLKPYLMEKWPIRVSVKAQLTCLYSLTISTDQCKWFMREVNKLAQIMRL